ncbi:hypothetical protein [Granulosicoccus antarcticus]|uniref:NodB homology domain-containing protein n=1 Tax=Granulosicoccus antarcticus IMCC3135 TaxID=1192854 RepID=A0A2Z2NUP3_9GAMM|nr:hypothetical protein [Granulosicoccus antarcticus]ASJ74973.1 hypothetical protein IMCC3135_24530 [Granulosicoccus antarcticus IMCC3135]
MINGSKIEKLVVSVSIDTECDHDPAWIRSNPLAFDSINEGLPNRLQPAFEAVGAIPTYLLTVEVLEDSQSVQTLRKLAGNYEYGTHLHAAFIEPEKKFHDYAGVDSPDFQCSYAPDVEYQKLANLTRLFEQQLGYSPTSFRAGRYGASADSINSLQKLGYKVDTSVTPYIRWREPNAVVDFRKSPEQPYFPAPGSISSAGPCTPGRLLEVPVTVKPRLFRDPRWFRPWFASVEQMKEIVRYQMKKHRNERVLSINMMFHSMEVIEKASPYPQSADDVKRFIDDMQAALQWCAEEGGQFVPLSALNDLFQTA